MLVYTSNNRKPKEYNIFGLLLYKNHNYVAA